MQPCLSLHSHVFDEVFITFCQISISRIPCQRGNSIFGYVYDEELVNTSEYPDGTKRPYFTISYANGPGYFNHYVTNGNEGASPWKDPRDLDFENVDFKQPAMMPGPDSSESHGGEDVSVYATGMPCYEGAVVEVLSCDYFFVLVKR